MGPLQEIHNGVKPSKSYLKERTSCCPGPKPKPLNERPYKPPKPVQWVQRSYSRERKIEVILFREHHRVQAIDPNTGLLVYRPPTFLEMAAFWKIHEATIRGWWHSRETIITSQSCNSTGTYNLDLYVARHGEETLYWVYIQKSWGHYRTSKLVSEEVKKVVEWDLFRFWWNGDTICIFKLLVSRLLSSV